MSDMHYLPGHGKNRRSDSQLTTNLLPYRQQYIVPVTSSIITPMRGSTKYIDSTDNESNESVNSLMVHNPLSIQSSVWQTHRAAEIPNTSTVHAGLSSDHKNIVQLVSTKEPPTLTGLWVGLRGRAINTLCDCSLSWNPPISMEVYPRKPTKAITMSYGHAMCKWEVDVHNPEMACMWQMWAHITIMFQLGC